jgi:hypothetical protein
MAVVIRLLGEEDREGGFRLDHQVTAAIVCTIAVRTIAQVT